MRWLFLAAVLLAGCGSLDQQYVEADRATFDAIAPPVRALADEDPSNDPDLTGVNGRALLELLETWELRIQAAEGK